MWYIYYDWGISGFFGLLSFLFILSHSLPHPQTKKKNNPKNQKQDKMMVSIRKTLIKSYLW